MGRGVLSAGGQAHHVATVTVALPASTSALEVRRPVVHPRGQTIARVCMGLPLAAGGAHQWFEQTPHLLLPTRILLNLAGTNEILRQ